MRYLKKGERFIHNKLCYKVQGWCNFTMEKKEFKIKAYNFETDTLEYFSSELQVDVFNQTGA